MRVINCMATLLAISLSFNASGEESSCSAENPDQGQTCSISCSTGQAARCEDATGNGYPSCVCEGETGKLVKSVFFKRQKSPFGDLISEIDRTDVVSTINKKLSTFIYHTANSCTQVKVGRECEPPPFLCPPPRGQFSGEKCGGISHCSDIYESRCSPINGPLTARTPFSIEAEPKVTVQEPNWDGIPSNVLGLKVVYRNCSSVEQSKTFRHIETVKVGSRVVKTKTIDVGTEVGAKVSFSFISPGSEISAKFSSRVSATNSNEENYESTQSMETQLPIRVPPKTKITVTDTFIQREVPVIYTGIVQLDGAVSENLSGIKLISQVLQDANDRKFSFSGVVLNSTVYDGSTNVDSEDLKDCKGGVEMVVESSPFDGLLNTKFLKKKKAIQNKP